MHNEEYKFLHSKFVIGVSSNSFKNSKELLCISERNKKILLSYNIL